MAQYDGAIRIATKITTKDAEESLASLECYDRTEMTWEYDVCNGFPG